MTLSSCFQHCLSKDGEWVSEKQLVDRFGEDEANQGLNDEDRIVIHTAAVAASAAAAAVADSPAAVAAALAPTHMIIFACLHLL